MLLTKRYDNVYVLYTSFLTFMDLEYVRLIINKPDKLYHQQRRSPALSLEKILLKKEEIWRNFKKYCRFSILYQSSKSI